MDQSAGLTSDTSAGDAVVITVNVDGPYGVNFEPDEDGKAAVIRTFEKLPNGKFGPLQKHGGLHYGDILVSINGISLESVDHGNVLKMISDRNVLKKTLKFINSKEYYRQKRGNLPGNYKVYNAETKSNFLSSIRKYRISQDQYNKQFAEFEIACQYRIAGSRVQKDIVHKWSVWKRYSELDQFNNLLKKTLGWQMQGIEFAPSYTFSFNKLSSDFLEQRRDKLNQYWQSLILIDKITEFSKHHCSEELKTFLGVEDIIRNATVTSDSAEEANTIADDKKINKRISRGGGVRRKDTSKSIAFGADSGDNSSNLVTSTKVQVTEPVTQSVNKTVSSISSAQSTSPARKEIQTSSKPSEAIHAPAAKSVTTVTENPSSSASSLPKASGARVNLLNSINARRID